MTINKEVYETMTIAQEECAEVVQAISKIFRFGLDDVYNNESNRERLAGEVGDLLCMIDLMIEQGVIDSKTVSLAKARKLEKLKVWSSIKG